MIKIKGHPNEGIAEPIGMKLYEKWTFKPVMNVYLFLEILRCR
ncbi:hypothetical protein [Portibacter lacus]|nr:hypothetical protein [Portibacter lacus]